MMRTLPGDLVIACLGETPHRFVWLGHHRCPTCQAELPLKSAPPIPLPRAQDDPTGMLLNGLNTAIDYARRAPRRWRITGDWQGIKVAWDGDNSQAGRTLHAGHPYKVVIETRRDRLRERFASREEAFLWLTDHISSVPLWPWWTFQKER